MSRSTSKLQLFIILSVAVATPSVYAIVIPVVPIGNPGNPADMRYLDSGNPNGVGAVSYSFFMGKTEVTNTQYVAFLNAVASTDPYGLYNTNMGSATTWGGIVRNGSSGNYTYSVKAVALNGSYSYGEKPVVWVDWGDTLRFANWLHHGQPSGQENATTTEDGAYTLNGAVSRTALLAVTRNPGARWWLPNEDEWYKAAYHKNDGATANYWNYPTRMDNEPDNNVPSLDTGNSANFSFSNIDTTTGNSSYPATDAGAYTLSGSAYGTFDQGGNAEEWVETLVEASNGTLLRRLRGGPWLDNSQVMHAQYNYDAVFPDADGRFIGFRLAGVPEPRSAYVGALGMAMLSLWIGRKR
jgi:sulfatase modifying factor 1